MIEGIVLAGGKSTRAKTNKMLFCIDNKPLICHTIASLRKHVDHIIVVTGKYDKEIRDALKDQNDIQIIYNPIYEQGMFTSVKAGVTATKGDFFILPGDYPFITDETFLSLLKGKKSIRFPTFEGKDGHPIFISKDLKEDLLSESDDSNLHLFRDKHECERIPVCDPYILKDVDTIEDFEKLLSERK